MLRRFLFGCLVCVAVSGCKLGSYTEARSSRIDEIERSRPDAITLGAARFLFDDLGGLNTDTLTTNAYPWKVVVAAMAMEYVERTRQPLSPRLVSEMLQQYGWITPTGIDNWPGEQHLIRFDKPIGIVSGELRRKVPPIRLEVANMGCATCHAGPSYDAKGMPTGRIWLGSPNTSRYFDGYTTAIVSGLQYAVKRQSELIHAIKTLFPSVSSAELRTIKRFVLPQIKTRLKQAAASGEIFAAFDHGGAGLTNGLAALKLRIGAPLQAQAEHGYTAIPDLYSRALRSSYLYDGAYALRADTRFVERTRGDFTAQDRARLASIVAFFLVPSMGIKPDRSEQQAARVSDILEFVLNYKPQPFPGQVDEQSANVGRALYETRCSSCHGSYQGSLRALQLTSFPNRFVAQADINSDPYRWRAISDELVQKIRTTPAAQRVNAALGQGYVAPILGGLWASAPYLHNGSVPTLWHLMRPNLRPKRFYVGGHKLDFSKVGIAGQPDGEGVYRYPSGYAAWSQPVLLDTGRPGLSNSGHEAEFRDLAETEKDALLEFLKLL